MYIEILLKHYISELTMKEIEAMNLYIHTERRLCKNGNIWRLSINRHNAQNLYEIACKYRHINIVREYDNYLLPLMNSSPPTLYHENYYYRGFLIACYKGYSDIVRHIFSFHKMNDDLIKRGIEKAYCGQQWEILAEMFRYGKKQIGE